MVSYQIRLPRFSVTYRCKMPSSKIYGVALAVAVAIGVIVVAFQGSMMSGSGGGRGGSPKSVAAYLGKSAGWGGKGTGDSGGKGSAGSSLSCSSPLVSRGETSLEDLEEVLRASVGVPHRASQITDPGCPKWVFAFQNHGAGIGHRMTNWAMALHTAVVFNITFAHTSFDGGSGGHGNYNGWDSWLSFTVGEYGLDGVMSIKGMRKIELPSLGGYYRHNEEAMKVWNDVIRDPTACNVIYQVPQDQWMYDISSSTHAIMAHKFEMHTAHKRPKEPLEHWSHSDVNIVAHVRWGDQYPTNERVHARVIRETILPALADAGIISKVSVHVFAEDKKGDELPGLAALDGIALASVGDVMSSGGGGRSKSASSSPVVSVYFHPEADPQSSFWHLTQSDFLVMSFSSFSWAAAQVAIKPVSLAQPSSDIMKMCGEASACCHHDGTCSGWAHTRVRRAARRLAAREQACGGLE